MVKKFLSLLICTIICYGSLLKVSYADEATIRAECLAKEGMKKAKSCNESSDPNGCMQRVKDCIAAQTHKKPSPTVQKETFPLCDALCGNKSDHRKQCEYITYNKELREKCYALPSQCLEVCNEVCTRTESKTGHCTRPYAPL